jgi:pimeloyl-ACP methyl ester carboxylesterase
LTTELSFHFAHANGFPASAYKTLFSALPETFHRLHIERFGHEPAMPVNGNWRNQIHEMINHIKKHNTDERGVYAVGHSFGAVVSFMAACEQPALFRGLILFDPPLVLGPLSQFFRLAKHTPLINKLTPAKLADTRNTQWPANTNMEAYFHSKALFKNMDPRCVRDYVNAVTKQTGKHISLTFKADVEASIFRNIPHNLSKYRGKLQCPAVIVTGQQSNVCKPEMVKRLCAQNAIEHTTLEGGHMFPLEHPDVAADFITSTLRQWEERS